MLLPWSYLTHTQTQWSGRGCWLTLWGRARRDMHFKFFRYKVWSILLLNWSQLIMSPPPSDSLFPNPIIYYSPLQTVSFTISPPDACRVPHPLPVTGSAPPCTPVPKWTTTVPCSPINPNLIFSSHFLTFIVVLRCMTIPSPPSIVPVPDPQSCTAYRDQCPLCDHISAEEWNLTGLAKHKWK